MWPPILSRRLPEECAVAREAAADARAGPELSAPRAARTPDRGRPPADLVRGLCLPAARAGVTERLRARRAADVAPGEWEAAMAVDGVDPRAPTVEAPGSPVEDLPAAPSGSPPPLSLGGLEPAGGGGECPTGVLGVDTPTLGPETLTPSPETLTLGSDTLTLGVEASTPATDAPVLGSDTSTGGVETTGRESANGGLALCRLTPIACASAPPIACASAPPAASSTTLASSTPPADAARAEHEPPTGSHRVVVWGGLVMCESWIGGRWWPPARCTPGARRSAESSARSLCRSPRAR